MWDSIYPIVLGFGSMLLVAVVVFKVIIKKKKVQGMYAPYDDMSRGTSDVNGSRTPPVDAPQTIAYEESEKVE